MSVEDKEKQTCEADLGEFLYAWKALGSVSDSLDGAIEDFACATLTCHGRLN
jgi:hypothetical protein